MRGLRGGLLGVWIGLSIGWATAQGAATEAGTGHKELRVFFVDVEGGQATLFVAPGGESLLIDTGWPGNDGRDADRIVKAAKRAGLTRIDTVLLTHYHVDHVGGVPQLVARIPVGTFVDHGVNRELGDEATTKGYAEYQKVLAVGAYKHVVAKVGERLPVKGFDATVVSADGEVLKRPLAGGGEANAFCPGSEVKPEDATENARSLGVEVVFAGVRILDLGDLTWDKERTLMCPVNKLGRVDVLVVSHHGWNQSSSPALVDAVHPRVAVMDNGAKKGGSLSTLKTLESVPGLEALWQLHFSEEGGAAANTKAERIANRQGADAGNDLELTVSGDGSFVVTNGGTGYVERYGRR